MKKKIQLDRKIQSFFKESNFRLERMAMEEN